jgi:NADPH:quinone reductase-like Zn-dependent oxidoreductase
LRAVELRAFGGPEGLVEAELPDPEPGPGEVRVDLVAAALNRRDWWIRTGGKVRLPVVLGSDGAGVVSALGPAVGGVEIGDEVVIYPGRGWGDDDVAPAAEFELLGVPRQGTYAECIVVDADQVRPRPPGWSWAECAALPVAALTAWRALVRYADARGGRSILVLGAGGGVATFAIQIANALGARTLTTSSSRQKLQRALALGAAGGTDYRDAEWPLRIGPVDAVIDSVGGAAWPRVFRALRPGGILVTSGMQPDRVADYLLRELAELHARYRDADALRRHLAAAGFASVEARPDDVGLQTLVVARKGAGRAA